jgi:hypothetical protein
VIEKFNFKLLDKYDASIEVEITVKDTHLSVDAHLFLDWDKVPQTESWHNIKQHYYQQLEKLNIAIRNSRYYHFESGRRHDPRFNEWCDKHDWQRDND